MVLFTVKDRGSTTTILCGMNDKDYISPWKIL